MQPGRELDALIAEKVMGWVVDGDGEIFHGGVYLMDLNQWRPSTDIGCAWRVVNRMRELDYSLNISVGAYCHVAVDIHWDGKYYESAPSAICNAALHRLEMESRRKAA